MSWLSHAVHRFSPAWFVVNMGTGGISMLFHNYPYAYDSKPLEVFSTIFFFLNLVLFVLFNVLFIARLIIWPELVPLMVYHPVHNLYLGSYPMGLATLIIVANSVLNTEWDWGGKPLFWFIWAVWWYDVAIGFICGFVLIHLMFTRQHHELNAANSLWALPAVALIVVASAGGVLVTPLLEIDPWRAGLTLVVSAFLLVVGLMIGFVFFSLYFLRLILHGLPQGVNVLSGWITLGIAGQGGYAVLVIGQGLEEWLPVHYGYSSFMRGSTTGLTLEAISVYIGFILWSITTMWFFYNLLAMQEALRQGWFPFSLPWWELIFPNVVYANLTIELSVVFDSTFFRVWGAMYATATLLLWIMVFTLTIPAVISGEIFDMPDIEQIDAAERKAETQHSLQGAEQWEQGELERDGSRDTVS
ncbi:uncharacterized protein FIBRA_07563 [Fibroporia radiculosa]|uniref:C4-dicarboxylate transporter/malic acid transport protein n=1 Tax=Fibroporia radiculosa TaxID=599839 RepID=J4H4P5_9APHY|nr:uncharacterized protein FIBRA_07563 [Fibroporia radiculosa]CCM05349.1 predicted protein [Fibroporia radiculosa]